MRKIIFEQVTNILFTIITTFALTQTLYYSHFNPSEGQFDIKFGAAWSIFILAIILLTLLRRIYTKTLGKKDGYTEKTAELSSVDEREKLISHNATAFTYNALSLVLLLGMVISFVSNFVITDIKWLRMTSVITIGSCLVLLYTIYLISWIIYDNRL